VKTRRLPDTDLARIAPLPLDEKRAALIRQKTGFSNITYTPVRSCTLDILNAQSRLLGPTPETPLSVIEADIQKSAISLDEAESNLEVARLLFFATREFGFRSYQVGEFNGFTTRRGDSAAYWSKAIMVAPDGRLLIPHADYRRTFRLTAVAKKFAASVMHEALRAQNPTDFGSAKLAVFQFPQLARNGSRSVSLEVVNDVDLYSRDELAAMIAETFAMWDEVLEERVMETRRRGGSR